MTTIDARDRTIDSMDAFMAIRRECPDRNAEVVVTPDQYALIRERIETFTHRPLPTGNIKWGGTTIQPAHG